MEISKNTAMLSQDQLKDLSKDPKNIVVHFKEREKLKDSEIVPVDQVTEKIKNLYAFLTELRNGYISKNQQITKKRWNIIKKKILAQEEWKNFDYTHPLIFDRIVNPETTRKEIDALLKMTEMKQKNDTEDGMKNFHDYILKTFSITKEQYQEQKIRDGIK